MAKKISVAGEARRVRADERRAIKARSSTDSFQNFAAKLGVGTDNLSSYSTYGFNPITRVNTLLEWIHRGSWVGGVAVDVVADDMTRAGIEINATLEPDDNQQLQSAFSELGIWAAINSTAKWARLYGGAIGVIMIEGQDLRTPLRVETVGAGMFKGILAMDRWQVDPSLNDLVNVMGPDIGKPKYYRVLNSAPALRGQVIHYTRCVRLEGIELPYRQSLNESLWGLSVLERLYDRLIAFDSATTGIAQLVYKAYLRTYKIKNLRTIAATGGPQLDGLVRYVDMMRRFQTIEGITLLDAEDEFEAHAHQAFSGLGEATNQIKEQLSGALQIPLVRLFGQSPGGLNSSGDSDLRTYYDGIKQMQERYLRVPMTRVLHVTARSEGIDLGDSANFNFVSLWQMTDKEKADVAKTVTDAAVAAVEANLAPRAAALEEMRKSSRLTGIWSTISDEDIEKARELDEAPPPSEIDAFENEGGATGPITNEPGSRADNENGGDTQQKAAE